MAQQISRGWRFIGLTVLVLVPSTIVMCLSVIFNWQRVAEVLVVIVMMMLISILMTLACLYVPRWMNNANRKIETWLMSRL